MLFQYAVMWTVEKQQKHKKKKKITWIFTVQRQFNGLARIKKDENAS